MTRLIAGLLLYCSFFTVRAAEPNWIWSTKDANKSAPAGNVYFRRFINVESPSKGTLEITADNRFDLFINGRSIGAGDSWQTRTKYDIGPLLIPGRNLIAVRATNDGEDPAGLVVKVNIEQKDKPAIEIVTDAEWKFTTRQWGNWARPDFDDSNWTAAEIVGVYGKTEPWGAAGAVQTPQQAVVEKKPRSREKGFFDFRDGDRVVLLGSAFIERMQSHGYLETMITAGLPDKNITFRNLGWSGDTVWGDARGVFGGRAEGFRRLISDVNLCNPTVIIICYGENEAYEGETGLEAFRDGLNKLLETLETTGARLLLLSPRQHESLGYPLPDSKEYNTSLKLYRDVIKEAAETREHPFVDLYDTIRVQPVDRTLISANGIHLTPFGEWLLARELLPTIGVPAADTLISIDVRNHSLDAIGAQVFDLQTESNLLRFSAVLRGVELPRPEPVAQIRRLELKGLDPASYRLTIDGLVQRGPNGNSWNTRFTVGPPTGRGVQLQSAIAEKNALFFNRYRPQNETYLFLFRKHEQGNNAVEIPQFDPLIEAKEKEIAELKKPVVHKFELKVVE